MKAGQFLLMIQLKLPGRGMTEVEKMLFVDLILIMKAGWFFPVNQLKLAGREMPEVGKM